MKTALLAGLALSLAVIAAGRADLVIVQKVEGGGQSGDMTIKIKGDKSRTDLTPQLSMIADGATGETVTLYHAAKTFLKVPAAQNKAMTQQLEKMRPNAEGPKLQPTGRKEKVGDYDCEIFTTNMGVVTVTYWVAKDYPNYQAVVAQLDKFQSATVSAMGKGTMPAAKDFPGMTMKTEMDLSGKKTVTILVSAKEENVDPALFNIPAGYKETTSPSLNFQPAK